MIVAYQGEPGAFSDAAARTLVEGAQTRGYPTFDELVEAVDRGEVMYGLLPVENSIFGPIARSYDLLWQHQHSRIVDEIVFRVVMNLIGTREATEERIAEIRSHPVAMEQVRKYADAHPTWRRVVVEDTAGAVAQIVASGDPTVAAIGPALAAELYGGKILRSGIQDDAENFTRFFLLERNGTARRSLHRACVAFELNNRAGALRDALSAFADRNLDLRSLVSRPNHRDPFHYRFYCEIAEVDAGRLDAALADIDGSVRTFGVY
ncbi:MAG TPA: prephenate dehydratase domain-containing protein [Candidatus Acidoferrales bacterium]|nr:prephenate dehydratase domain-containing protein [Candidatus Acidoferrales bacterium]